MNLKKHVSPAKALRHFGRKQTLKGAIIIGILAGMMTVIQGAGYTVTYPDARSRAQFASSLESAPSLGVIYGESKNLVSASGYIVYRVVPFMSLIASIWGLVVVTKLLRGQEEDGRWELIASSNTSVQSATWNVLLGFAMSFGLALIISTLITTAGGILPDIAMSLVTSMLVTLAIFLPAAIFVGLGIFTSQLSMSRRRAMMYGLIPLLGFFALRALGNTISDVYWLKHVTPFGWSDLISPVINLQPIWFLPFIIATPMLVVLGIYLVGKRDLGAGILKESSSAKSHYFLLGSAGTLAIRQNILLFIGWGLAALTMSALIGAIASIAANSLIDSPAAKNVVSQLGGSFNDLKVAVIGAGLVFTVMVLLIMITTCMATIRGVEAKNYLDNLLVQPIRRSSWLIIQLLITVVAFTLISVLCALATWLIANAQHIAFELGNLLLVSIALTGTVIFTLGFGTLLYGTLPRLTVIGMYVVIGWSFIIDAIGAVVKLNDLIVKSSLFHYISFSPTKTPDWSTFAELAAIGVVMAAIGIVAFTKRDIIAE